MFIDILVHLRLLRTVLPFLPLVLSAQQHWTAQWIAAPDSPPADYAVYHFRRTFDLTAVPNSFPIRVTADNRYIVYLNGKRLGFGPARGDLDHWRYETYDIANQLHAGRNVLAAVVWNAGPNAPMAQDTNRTGFLLDGSPEVGTGTQWKCIRDEAYSPESATGKVPGYYAVGPTDHVDGSKYPWGWEQLDYDDSSWKSPLLLGVASDRDAQDAHTRWMLVPRPIPFEALQPEQPLRPRTEDVHQVPPHSSVTVLLDQGYETTGYPALTISGGKGATVEIGYAESLYVPGTHLKGNRNEVAGKQFIGYQDVFVSDGGVQRTYRPLWWRTWRYIQLKVTTEDSPLTVDSLTAEHNGYPFVLKAHFDGGPPDIQAILDVGWRTARLCAHETYMDCPYYEQLQYVGDTRIQSLVSLYMTGDGRLMRNAIEEIDASRTAEGATYSRAPSRLQQYIPPFSLWWIGMLHDYWMYQDDPAFIASKLNGVEAVLSFFRAHQKASGSLGPMPWWNFIDWSAPFPSGVPRAGADGSSAPLDLQLLLAYQWAADLEAALGSQTQAAHYRTRADELRSTIQSLYWDPNRQMYANTSEKSSFSQHAQALAVLA
ncbi:MAG TPA: family 78 glycoside hydrolase catalytic domain, partial [Bryobacteraceae bacterium]|nr:family 78 glycoside hydrolase catalytic domain [Bryobacteraceae bacterium]